MELGRALADRKVIDRTTVARHAMKAAVFSRRGLPDTRIDRPRESLLSAAADHDQGEIAAVAREVGPTIAASAHPAARWLIERHHRAGDVCVVVSASPQELVEVIGAALGADRVVGTRTEVVDGRFTGRLDGPFCHGAGKLERLEAEMGPLDLSQASAYADSGSDLPQLRACGHPVAVNPDRRLREAATEAGWPVLASEGGHPGPPGGHGAVRWGEGEVVVDAHRRRALADGCGGPVMARRTVDALRHLVCLSSAPSDSTGRWD